MRIAFAVLLFAATLSACSSGEHHAASDPTEVPTVSEEVAPAKDRDVGVTLGEWSVVPEHVALVAGKVTFSTKNEGQHAHEMAVLRTDLDSAELPTKDDGTVDEDELDVVARVDSLDPGDAGDVDVELEAGAYVLLCNLIDEMDDEEHVHYEMGMRTALRVAPGAE